MGREKLGKPRRERVEGVRGTGIYYRASEAVKGLRDPGPGRHLWAAFPVFQLTDESARAGMSNAGDIHLDMENLAEFYIGCYKCEEPWRRELADLPCTGKMDP